MPYDDGFNAHSLQREHSVFKAFSFLTELVATLTLTTSALKSFAASSKEFLVLVEGS